MKTFGGHDLRKRNTVGITPWGAIDNNTDLIGRDVSAEILMNEIAPIWSLTTFKDFISLNIFKHNA